MLLKQKLTVLGRQKAPYTCYYHGHQQMATRQWTLDMGLPDWYVERSTHRDGVKSMAVIVQRRRVHRGISWAVELVMGAVMAAQSMGNGARIRWVVEAVTGDMVVVQVMNDLNSTRVWR